MTKEELEKLLLKKDLNMLLKMWIALEIVERIKGRGEGRKAMISWMKTFLLK